MLLDQLIFFQVTHNAYTFACWDTEFHRTSTQGFVSVGTLIFPPCCFLQARDDELTQMHLEISKMNKVRDVLQSKLRAAEDKKVAAGHERETLKRQISGLERGRCLILMNRSVLWFTICSFMVHLCRIVLFQLLV